jgi:FkbM family methyltransferase
LEKEKLSMFSRIKKWLQKEPAEKSFGLKGLDLALLPWLDFRDGFFIEAGANNGVKFSNTLFFERYRNWRGLLIEPIPELAAECRKNRPLSIVENCALVAAGSAQREVAMRYCNMMSIVKGAMQSEEGDLDHIKKGCEVQQIESYELTVPARPLSELLDAHGITHVDFFSLDVEGYELEALKGIDFARHAPRFLLVECRDRATIENFLGPRYEAVADLSHHDVLFRAR